MGIFPIDIEILKKDPEKYREAFRKRYMDEEIVDKALDLYYSWKEKKEKEDEIRSKINKITKLYGILTRESVHYEEIEKLGLKEIYEEFKDKISKEGLEILKKEVKALNEIVKEIEKERKKLYEELVNILYKFPNFIDEDVPIGPDDTYNVPLEFWGVPRVSNLDLFKEQTEKYGFKIVELKEISEKYVIDRLKLRELYEILKGENDFFEINFDEVLDFEKLNKEKIVPYVKVDKELKHHYDLVYELNLVDTEIASKVSGSRFYFEFGDLVFLDFALSLYSLKFYKNKGYGFVLIPPYLMKKEVESRITYYEAFKDSIYHVVEDNLILIPTSEHPIVTLYMDKVLREEELPIRILAWSPAFRKEAGAHGKDTKGIFRTHQFHKVELHIICKLEEDRKYLSELYNIFKEFMKTLNIPFRMIVLSSGDMDRRARIQYDLEAWFPGQQRYRELGSLATVGDWISRKLNIRVGKNYVANLYSTGAAIQRTICCILENFYDMKNRRVVIPKVLRKYLEKDYITFKA